MNDSIHTLLSGGRWGRTTLILFTLGLLAALSAVRPAQAATFNPCTAAELSANITTANGNGEADTINLSAACTYALTSALPQITTQITINGNGATITRSSGNIRILSVSSSGNLTLNNATIQNGSPGNNNDGAGLLNDGGTVTINDSTFSNNTTTISGMGGNGGGAINTTGGSVNITNSTFSGNTATSRDGGAIRVTGGAVKILNSTFSNNSAGDQGGALYASGGTTDVINSTFHGNTASTEGGAIYSTGGGTTVRVTNSTIADNSATGGTVRRAGGTFLLRNSIVKLNSGTHCSSAGGGSITGSNNAVTGTGCPGNLSPQPTVATLALGALADNGGKTQTMALGASSVAINEGSDAICETATTANPPGPGGSDQRGEAHVVPCDIGAFEYTPGVYVTPTSVNVTEGGATATYQVRLKSQPANAVTINIAPDTQISVSPTSLNFTTANWNVNQTVTVTAVDDNVAEGNHVGAITHSSTSADANFTGLTIASVTANITDNDTAGVTISPTTVNVTEGTGNATYNVKLNSQPTADVTINVTPDGQVTVGPASLTFTPANWNIDQAVTVTAVDDDIAEGNHTGAITHAASSSDPNYNGGAVTIANVTANITDNDTAGVTIDPTSVAVTEGAGSDSYNVRLTSEPTGDVIINISGDADASVNPTSLTFTPLNWNTNQAVTVTAVDDDIAEGGHTGTISHSASSSDGNYNGITIANVTANITDNDTAGVTIAPTNVNLVEGAGNATYNVKLTSQPTADVTINVTPDQQVSVNPTSLTFTPANWNTNQTLTVTAIDDDVAEDDHEGTITHSASSNDANYNGANVTIANVTANITDNDTAGVLIIPTSVNVTEGGATDTYQVVLTSQPTADVTINVTPDAQTDVDQNTLVFTSADWDTAQTVTVSALDDPVVEGPHSGAISHSASSSDPKYNNIGVAGVTVSITDNDTAGVSVTPATIAIAEGGSGVDYSVVLLSQPTANVTINISPDAQSTVAPTTLTFTPATWNTPQWSR